MEDAGGGEDTGLPYLPLEQRRPRAASFPCAFGKDDAEQSAVLYCPDELIGNNAILESALSTTAVVDS